MENTDPDVGKIKTSGSSFRKEKVQVIWIDCKFFSYAQHADPQYTTRDVEVGRVKRDKVIKDSIRIVKRIGDLAVKDLANIKKCVAFITERFPHAHFSFYLYALEIDKLSQDEMAECLNQTDLRFKFFESD